MTLRHARLPLPASVVLASLLCLGAPVAGAAEQRIECPPTVSEQDVALHAPAGWTAFVPSALRLHSAAPMSGPPSDKADLVPTSVQKRRNGSTERWELGAPLPGGTWMSCGYGLGNEVVLSRRIADDTSECTVAYTKNRYGSMDLDIRCKSGK